MSQEPQRLGPPLDLVEYERWRRTAESNLQAARREADADAHHIACMLAEQAAQCSLKGFLHGVGQSHAAYGHGLVRLAEEALAQVESELGPSVRAALQRLTQLYLPSRYPDALPEGTPLDSYGPEHSRQAIDDATAAVTTVGDLWVAVVAAAERDEGEGSR